MEEVSPAHSKANIQFKISLKLNLEYLQAKVKL
jgi:hypothetical protein